MKNKEKILILGANSDIAKQLLLKFYKKNFEFILLSRNIDELNIFLKKNSLDKKLIKVYKADLSDINNTAKILESIKIFPNITICASGELKKSNRKINYKNSIIRKMMNDNYIYPAENLELISQYLIKYNMKNSSIIGISSIAGQRGKKSNYEYGAAKAAFSTFLSGLRNKLYKNNIHICTVEPGYVKTKMTKKIKVNNFLSTTPKEIADEIYEAISNKSDKYIPLKWKIIMFIIKLIPERIFKRLDL